MERRGFLGLLGLGVVAGATVAPKPISQFRHGETLAQHAIRMEALKRGTVTPADSVITANEYRESVRHQLTAAEKAMLRQMVKDAVGTDKMKLSCLDW